MLLSIPHSFTLPFSLDLVEGMDHVEPGRPTAISIPTFGSEPGPGSGPQSGSPQSGPEYVYRYAQSLAELRGATRFSNGLWRSPCVIVSSTMDYDGLLAREEGVVDSVQKPQRLHVYRCRRADFESACLESGFGFEKQIQGRDHRVVAVVDEDDTPDIPDDITDDTPDKSPIRFSESNVHVVDRMPRTFLDMWEHVGCCALTTAPSSCVTDARAEMPAWSSYACARLDHMSPNTDIALAAKWCVREMGLLCGHKDVQMGSAFSSPRGRVVLQWVVELLRLDCVMQTMRPDNDHTVLTINKFVGDLRSANPGVTHDPRGCFVMFTLMPEEWPHCPLKALTQTGTEPHEVATDDST